MLVQILVSTEDKHCPTFCAKITNRKGGMHWNIVMKQPFHPPKKNQTLFSSLPLSAFSSPSDNTACSSGHEIEIHDELYRHNQKTQSASLSHWNKLAMLFGVWVKFLRLIMKNGILLQYHSYKPKFHNL